MEKMKELKDLLFAARKILCVPSGEERNDALALTAMKNLSGFGFVIDSEGAALLKTATKDNIAEWYRDAEKKLMELCGADKEYHPFYPNFPEEVMEKSDLDLFLDQICHYITVAVMDVSGEDVEWKPDGRNEKKGKKAMEEHPLKVIPTMAEDEMLIQDAAREVFINTLAGKENISSHNLCAIVNRYIEAVPDWIKDAGAVENRALLSYLYAAALHDGTDVSVLPALVTGDYLRILQIVHEMDQQKESAPDLKEGRLCSLSFLYAGSGKAKVPKRIPRRMRRFLAAGLNEQASLEEDVARNKEQWIRAFQYMHVGEMGRYENLLQVADKLRNGKLDTFYAKIDRAFADGNLEKAMEMYGRRPGEFIKNWNRLFVCISKIEDEKGRERAVKKFLLVAEDVFPKVKIEDLAKFIGYIRSRKDDRRVPMHKIKNGFVITEQKHPAIDAFIADLFVEKAKKSIQERIATRSYGKTYIDPALMKFPLPLETAAVESGMKTYPAGARIPIERNEDGTAKNMRAFIWWTNMENQRVDLDLSANCYKEDPKNPGMMRMDYSVAFHSSYCCGGLVHSGDITSGGRFGGDGVCEYIDFNIDQLKADGVRYVEAYVNSYTGQPFGEVPHLFGWQERKELDKSDQFDPKAVKQAANLPSFSRGAWAFTVDVEAEEAIWLGIPHMSAGFGSNSNHVIDMFNGILCRYAGGSNMTMHEMAELAIAANGGEKTDDFMEADVAFFAERPDVEWEKDIRIITASDLDIWKGEFLVEQTPEPEPSYEDSNTELSTLLKEKPDLGTLRE